MIRKVTSTNWFDDEGSPPPLDGSASAAVEADAASEVDLPEAVTVERMARSRRRRVTEVEPAEVTTITPKKRSRRRVTEVEPPKVTPIERQARSRAPWRRVASIAFFVAIIGFWVIALRPEWMGGSASVLTVRGQSMEPTYSYGDIIIAHRHGSYQVGDIIAFKVPEGDIGAGTVVIHRIIGGDATTGFVTQGDNNPDPDEWRPVSTDILGSATWRIPMVGRLLSVLRTVPGIAGVAGILAALLVVLGTESPAPRQRRRPEGADGDDPVPLAEAPTPPAPVPVPVPVPMEPAAHSVEELIPPPPVANVPTPPIDDSDHEVVGEYWGDLDYLAAMLRERSRPNAVFDDNLNEVARPLV